MMSLMLSCWSPLILLAAIFSLTLGIHSYRVFFGHMRTLADVAPHATFSCRTRLETSAKFKVKHSLA